MDVPFKEVMKDNGSIRTFGECLNKMQKPGKGAELSEVPDVLTCAGKIRLALRVRARQKQKLLRDLRDCTNRTQLRKTLEGRDLWRVSYKNDPADDNYPGRGWCGYLAYIQIRMGRDTPPDPSTDAGAQTYDSGIEGANKICAREREAKLGLYTPRGHEISEGGALVSH